MGHIILPELGAEYQEEVEEKEDTGEDVEAAKSLACRSWILRGGEEWHVEVEDAASRDDVEDTPGYTHKGILSGGE